MYFFHLCCILSHMDYFLFFSTFYQRTFSLQLFLLSIYAYPLYLCFTVFHIYMTYFIFIIEPCVFCLHLFPLFLFNLVYSASFLSIVCCSFYIRLRISAIIQFFLSFIPQDNLFCCCSLCLLLRHSTLFQNSFKTLYLFLNVTTIVVQFVILMFRYSFELL